ncbi:3D domain-containing protein [Heyndrickxia oleronia]|uniref:3D domain-containing protein n=1 Tax=Heyndrickxia oleronia TaxID=38875 RepID=UPI003F29C2FA
MKQSTARNLMIAGSLLVISTVSITYSDMNREKLKLKQELESERKISVELTNSYNKLNEEYDKQIKFTNEQKSEINNLNEEIKKKNQAIESKDSKIHSLEQQLEKAKKRNESPTGRVIYVTATAYTSFCKEGCIGKTNLGIDVSNTIYHEGLRVIATDPSIIKPYSLVKVESRDETFVAIAGDTGGAINGNKIDVLVSVRNEAIANQFGRQHNVKVTVLREGKGGK